MLGISAQNKQYFKVMHSFSKVGTNFAQIAYLKG